MPESQIRLDIRDAGFDHWTWVVQTTGPVEDLFSTHLTFPTRAEALADFQRVCAVLGWRNDITQVPVR